MGAKTPPRQEGVSGEVRARSGHERGEACEPVRWPVGVAEHHVGCAVPEGVGEFVHDPPGASLLLAGIDISKWAVRAAARRSPGIAWGVASNRGLPVAANSFDVVLSLLGFPVWSEFARVLAEGGEVLVVDPAPDHLRELRELIYEEVRPSPQPAHPAAAEAGYVCVETQPVRCIAEVESDGQVAALLRMTPHAHRTSQERREVVDALPRLVVTVDVLLRRYVASAASD